MDLSHTHCIPCEAGGAPFTESHAREMLEHLPAWKLDADTRSISREFIFKNFADAMLFANKIAAIAEQENHHPDLTVKWGSVRVELSTHSIGGLSENDFILAAKINVIE